MVQRIERCPSDKDMIRNERFKSRRWRFCKYLAPCMQGNPSSGITNAMSINPVMPGRRYNRCNVHFTTILKGEGQKEGIRNCFTNLPLRSTVLGL